MDEITRKRILGDIPPEILDATSKAAAAFVKRVMSQTPNEDGSISYRPLFGGAVWLIRPHNTPKA